MLRPREQQHPTATATGSSVVSIPVVKSNGSSSMTNTIKMKSTKSSTSQTTTSYVGGPHRQRRLRRQLSIWNDNCCGGGGGCCCYSIQQLQLPAVLVPYTSPKQRRSTSSGTKMNTKHESWMQQQQQQQQLWCLRWQSLSLRHSNHKNNASRFIRLHRMMMIVIPFLFLTMSMMILFSYPTTTGNSSSDCCQNNDTIPQLYQQRQQQQQQHLQMDPFPRWLESDNDNRNNHNKINRTLTTTTTTMTALIQAIHIAMQNSVIDTTTNTITLLPDELEPSFQNVYIITKQSDDSRNSSRTNNRDHRNDYDYLLYKLSIPNTQSQMVQDRARFMEPLILQMLQQQQQQQTGTTGSTTNIRATRQQQETTSTVTETNDDDDDTNYFHRAIQRYGGIIYVVSYTDSQFCCNGTTTTTTTTTATRKERILSTTTVVIPIFTLSAPIDCQYAFPIPTYETIVYTQKLETSLQKRIISIQFMDRYMKYPWWYRRYTKAVWRGSPTGSINPDTNIRWMLCNQSIYYPNWIDAKFVGTTQRWPILTKWNNSRYIGDRISIRDMQHYRAIIDVDGNSWSARFGTLLCQSSVVLKVQPTHVDYFYPTLQAWKHYIPIKADLSNLIEQVQWATSDRNTAMVQQIIMNANQWCDNHMTTSHLINDMKSIFETYISKIMIPQQQQQSLDDPSVVVENPYTKLWIPSLLQQYNFTRVVQG